MKSSRSGDGERILAVFIDFENLALGFGNRRDRFSIEKVLERLVEKGKIVAKKAYADWSRFGHYTTSLHEAAVELTEIPKRMLTGKNSADIRMCVDAMDLAYSKDHIDTFVVVSGDSDFSPLVSKLKELGKHVIGLGLADSTSDLLRDNCDEFIYYEDLDRAPIVPLEEDQSIPENKRKVFALLLDSLLALRRENKELIFSSMVKDTMKRKKPSFNEEYHGYRTFSELLEDAQRHGIVDIEKHKTSGTYVVLRFGAEPRLAGSTPVALPPVPRPLALPAPLNGGRPQQPLPAVPQPQRPLPPVEPPKTQAHGRPPVGFQPERGRNDRRVEPEPATPPVRRVLTLPPKPPVVAPPPPVARFDEVAENDDDRMPLGRALIDDAEIFDDDDLDEVPSYMPRKLKTQPASAKPPVTPKPATKPAARQPKPAKADAATPVKKPAAPRTRTAKPETPAEPKPAPARKVTPKAETPPPPKPIPPAPKSVPQPQEDDGFGAGLDL